MAVQGLEYIISLTDQISAPLKGVMKSLDDVGVRGEKAMRKIAYGVAGVVAAGATLKAALDTAIDFNRALNEVKATGMGESGLKKVTSFALDFSSQFGLAAKDVVGSVNEIARAIDGLTDDEMIAFSESANILAKATGSNTKEMGSYITTMSNIFKDEMNAMGKSDWVRMMGGQATLTANMFKSSGESLSQAFSNLGSKAHNAGITMAEQFAVLGNVQGIMDGGKSGTAYKSFLENALDSKKMQKKLGMTFVDAKGDLMPIVDILNKIKKQFGNLGKAELEHKLGDAFGVGGTLAGLLLDKTTKIKEQIFTIGKIKGLEEAYSGSKVTTDSWMRLSAILQNIRIAIGSKVLAKLEPIMNKIADMGQEFTKWLDTYQNIARWIGYVVGALLGFTGLTAALTLISGVVAAIGVAFSAILGPIGAVIALIVGLGVLIYKFRAQFAAFIGGFIAGFKAVGVSFDPLFNAFSLVWGAIKKVGAAIGRIIALFSGASSSAYSFQQFGVDLGYALGVVFQTILDGIEFVAVGFNFIADLFGIVADVIVQGWTLITTLWDSDKPLESFLKIASGLGDIFMNAFRNIINAFVDVINFIVEKANTLPGIDIPLVPKWEDPNEKALGGLNGMQGVAGIAGAALSVPNLTTSGTTPPMPKNVGLDSGKPLVVSPLAIPKADHATAQPQSGKILPLPNAVQPQLTQMQPGTISKTVAQNQTTDKSLKIYGGITINANDPQQFEQYLRDKQQLAAG